jgi:hypothetical protein
MLQVRIPLAPRDGQPVNEEIWIVRGEGRITFFNGSGPIYSCSEDDSYGMRLAHGLIIANTSVKPGELASAMGVNRTTVYRNHKRFAEGGASALLTDRESHRKPQKLYGDKLKRAQGLLNKGLSLREIGSELGVTEGCIRYALRKGTLVRKASPLDEAKVPGPSQRSQEDSQCPGGMGVKRETERLLASTGKLEEALPRFSANESVRYAGMLLTIPLLIQLGLVEAGNKVYGGLRRGFYGLGSILLTLAFMGFLRIKTPEQLKGKSPGELGIVLGLDRAPEVKTLRRKLKELGLCEKASEFMAFLTKRWTNQDRDAIGFTYIDGHVRPYHGCKHKLPKTHVARRRLCMPATTDVWVNDARGEPLFLVTAEANDHLLWMLDHEILPELRALAGPDRRITIVFDREVWSPKTFARWFAQGFDVITYRKGKYEPWPESSFVEVQSRVRGKPVVYRLGERSVQLGKALWMREVRRLCDNGHQTSVMTTRQDLSAEEIARRMFFRWNQENFFRYMRQEYSLDHLLTYDVIPADGERLVLCPERKEKTKAIAKLKADLENLRKEYGRRTAANDEAIARGESTADDTAAAIRQEMARMEEEINQAKAERKLMPKRVPIKTVLKQHELVRLETERKYLCDAVKMVCYRAETSLFNLVAPHFARAEDEGRAFLKSVFELPADIAPDEANKKLMVRFHSMSNQRSNRALSELCEIMTAQSCRFPQTDLKLVFETSPVASKTAGCQEF